MNEWEASIPVDLKNARRKKADLIDPAKADREIPQAFIDEQALLGCNLMEPDLCVPRTLEVIGGNGEAFYDLRHKTIWEAVAEMFQADKSRKPDVVGVQQFLRDKSLLESVGGISYLAALPDATPSAAHLEDCLQAVAEKWQRRKIIQACTECVASAYECRDMDEMLDAIRREIETVDNKRGSEDAKPRKYLQSYMEDLEIRFNLQGALPGLSTGFYDYDAREGGLRFKEMVIVGARPYEGKTALACNLAEHACIIGRTPTLFISLEMTRNKLLDRFTALLTGLDIADLGKGKLYEGDDKKIIVSNGRVNSAPLFIVEETGGMSSVEACATIRRYARQEGVRLVIIDYLQKLTNVGKHEKTTYGIGDTCKRLRHAAIKSGVALLALAQLNREIDKGKKPRAPRMSDLADSKAIEAEADTVILLERDGEDRNLLVPKSRNSGGSAVFLQFDPRTLRFKNKSKIDDKDAAWQKGQP